MRHTRKLVSFVIPLIVGISGFLNVASKPRFETFHTVDVVQLIATGMCFGIAFLRLLTLFRSPDSD